MSTLFRPSILISDAYGSVKAAFPGTAAQLDHLAIHRRAMAAWASLDRDTQLRWNSYETTAEPHRPPFDHNAHISGNNLFVSAYHGFALMGDEHTPEPQPFQMPPPFLVSFESTSVEDGALLLTVDAHVSPDDNPERFRLYARLRLTYPGNW